MSAQGISASFINSNFLAKLDAANKFADRPPVAETFWGPIDKDGNVTNYTPASEGTSFIREMLRKESFSREIIPPLPSEK